ncbi:uncharacterized protein BDW47DRAFT_113527 [Aspergillus candidus]|uniref:Uncharacterized protein n=1 Tax=Aspergillus candidus TaxID=41067 RepID=A0A2I2EZ71_ASPCN|nr:hypothetical protein BDW47DRAFT_113527 [Aspergillus candidus]PLB33674.1 hypothetical protein BDW47DRAFT_113527 [Aspergillus candidus]
MKRCLGPARLPCLGCRFISPSPSISHPRALLPRARQVGRPFPGRRQWSRPFSAHTRPPIDRRLLEKHVQLEMKRCPVPGPQEKNPEAWLSLLDQYIPPSLRKSPENAAPDAVASDGTAASAADSLVQTIELTNLLFHARMSGNLGLLSQLGFRKHNWPAVHALLNRLLDAADTLNEVAVPSRPLSNLNWGSGSSESLDELTAKRQKPVPRLVPGSEVPLVPGFTSLDAMTERPLADDHSKRFMAELWPSLGSIILDAADAPPSEAKLAMSYVFQVLARLHHSGAVSDRVYKYIPGEELYKNTLRPPGIHLLSTHIVSVLSDAAWLVHEAEVAAKAAAAGEDSPYVPFRMGIRELGPEIWLEFILWCCVEHGHVTEGIWLIEQMKRRKGDQAWGFRSWKPLLEDPTLVRDTNIDREDSWRQPGSDIRPSPPRRRVNPTPFNGLGKRTVSEEVVASLLDNLPNLVYLGLGFRGVSPTALIRSASSLKFAITPTSSDSELLPTSRSSNWFTVRVLESGGFDAKSDPQAFENLLRLTPHVVPPWESNLELRDEDLDPLTPSQLYDETAALSGLIEYNIRYYALQRLCGDAINAFEWLQAVTDASKMQRIGDFFSSSILDKPPMDWFPTFDMARLPALRVFESSIPQVSNITLAHMLDLVTVSREYAFGEWMLFSSDIDGSPIPPSAYGDQALAPAIIRFAAATKNTALCDATTSSLGQPLSANILRTLLNFRVAMGQWDQVVPMLEYLREYRAKSWGHSNVAALAAAVIRLEHTAQQNPADPQASNELTQAKDILRRLLSGEFNEPHRHSETHYQDRSLHSLIRLFQSIPGGSLKDTATAASAALRARFSPSPHSAIPHIPAATFHPILSAVVDTQGSAAGKRLWDRWCLDLKSPTLRRLQEGGIPRLYLNKERNRARGDPHFDAQYFKQIQSKAVLPNANTIRIIAQAAVKEYNEYQSSSSPSSTESAPSGQGQVANNNDTNNPARPILEFCIEKFETFRVRRREINREVGGLLYRRRRERGQSKTR